MSYDQLYCYDTNTVDCGVYVRVLPFEGKGVQKSKLTSIVPQAQAGVSGTRKVLHIESMTTITSPFLEEI